MPPAIASREAAISAAVAAELRLDYGSSAPDQTHIYPVFEPRIAREAFLQTIVRLGPAETARLSRLLRHAAHGPASDWSSQRQSILHAFYVANLQDAQLAALEAASLNAQAA